MPLYRDALPQLAGSLLLADGGLETTLVFLDGVDLPCFASFPLLNSDSGREKLRKHYDSYLKLAADSSAGFLFDLPTWRANTDWAAKLGVSPEELAAINRAAVDFALERRDMYNTPKTPVVVSGTVGPRGDGYRTEGRMSADEAQQYHAPQIDIFGSSQADMLTAYTLTYPEEAVGIVRAAQRTALPVAISFTVETDGRLPCGLSLADAIELVDKETQNGPVYYGINCAHPTHFADTLQPGSRWFERVRSVRPNASAKSHAELDDSTVLDIGDPADLGRRCADLLRRMPQVCVVGGCCGTDVRHVGSIWHAFSPR
eukprot:TRINITY_DN22507_c0_g1_i1.p1 TRINITY_DN22507_c0_g1~~TRINITY_DN22507_c0_g1_i1.p1  ORF type:complete len:315 (+),score=114.30 TRINITY_DN22507_c0_g1_i1:123-1067(+)